MAITALPTPPSRSNPTNFATAADTFMAALPLFVSDANALAANLNSIASGGAYAIPYTFSTTTTDADPTAGFLRLDNATQNLATTIRMEVVGAGGSNWQSVIDTFDASSSAVKGSIRIFKQGDATKWLMFNVTARAALTGYRNISVTCTGSSSANPFVSGDAVMVHFQRTGDVGTPGVLQRRTFTEASNTAPSTNIALYDMHIISALAGSLTIGAPTGAPAEGQSLMYRIKDNGTSRTISYTGVFRAPTELAFPSTTVVGKWTYLGFVYNATDAKWDMIAALSNM